MHPILFRNVSNNNHILAFTSNYVGQKELEGNTTVSRKGKAPSTVFSPVLFVSEVSCMLNMLHKFMVLSPFTFLLLLLCV